MTKILLVDDELEFVKGLKEELEDLENSFYEIQIANSCKEALEILSQDDFHILVTDIRMPGEDGFKLIEESLKLYPDIQCIVFTAYSEIEYTIKAMRLGAINFLIKPFGVDALYIAIQKGIEKLNLILENRKKQKKIEKFNILLLSGLHKKKYIYMLVDLMCLSLSYWKLTTKKTKVALVEESGLWKVTDGEDGPVTKTFDKYLRIDKIPKKNPNYDLVSQTAYHVYYNCKFPNPEMKQDLKKMIDKSQGIYKRYQKIDNAKKEASF